MSKAIRPKRKVIVNPINGEFDFVSDNNFSYENVPVGKKLTIPANNQMVVHDEFQVDGEVDLKGSIILEE